MSGCPRPCKLVMEFTYCNGLREIGRGEAGDGEGRGQRRGEDGRRGKNVETGDKESLSSMKRKACCVNIFLWLECNVVTVAGITHPIYCSTL